MFFTLDVKKSWTIVSVLIGPFCHSVYFSSLCLIYYTTVVVDRKCRRVCLNTNTSYQEKELQATKYQVNCVSIRRNSCKQQSSNYKVSQL